MTKHDSTTTRTPPILGQQRRGFNHLEGITRTRDGLNGEGQYAFLVQMLGTQIHEKRVYTKMYRHKKDK